MPYETRPGAALVKLRWDKATAEERAKQAALMNDARWAEHRAKLAAEGKAVKPRRRPRLTGSARVPIPDARVPIPDSGESIRPRKKR